MCDYCSRNVRIDTCKIKSLNGGCGLCHYKDEIREIRQTPKQIIKEKQRTKWRFYDVFSGNVLRGVKKARDINEARYFAEHEFGKKIMIKPQTEEKK